LEKSFSINPLLFFQYRNLYIKITFFLFKKSYYRSMNFYEKKLKEKKEYAHKIPKEKKELVRKKKAHNLQHTKKNAQLGVF